MTEIAWQKYSRNFRQDNLVLGGKNWMTGK